MSDREPLTPELKSVEAALASLAPSPPSIADRDRWMFAAGCASASAARRGWLMPVAAIVFSLGAYALGTQHSRYFGLRPAVEIAAPSPSLVEEKFASTAELISPSSYLQLRRSIDDLDASVAASTTQSPMQTQAVPVSRQEMFRELLN